MSLHGEPVSAFLVVRVWRSPGGELCTRVGAVTHCDSDLPAWAPAVGVDNTLGLVRAWLERWSADPDLPADSPVAPAAAGTEHVH
jgi:hypothetical protein